MKPLHCGIFVLLLWWRWKFAWKNREGAGKEATLKTRRKAAPAPMPKRGVSDDGSFYL